MLETKPAIDMLPAMGEATKRDLEATAWAIALATPGLFAGLSQVGSLFKASRVPWAFGYLFGTMEVILLLTIYVGLQNYTRLHSILSVQSTIQTNRWVRESYKDLLVVEWDKPNPDLKKIEEYQQRVQKLFDGANGEFELLATLQVPGPHVSLTQRRLLEFAHLLFVLIILTSDFARLLHA